MKYITILALTACLAGCFGRTPSKTGLEGKPMPSFNLLLMDSATRLNTNNIPTGKPIVLLFISPYCPYCQAQMEEILANMESFTHVRFYILTTFPLQSLKQYADYYHLNKYTNITVGQDYDSYFVTYFKVTSIPRIAIYSKDKLLKQVMTGKVDISLIKKVALE